MSLSRGGGDATVVREFDVDKKSFVPNGFTLPEAKSRIAWKDENTIFVGTDFGQGSMTQSGYPRIAKEWKRGTPLTEAKTVFEGRETDVSVTCYRQFDHGHKRDACVRGIDFERTEMCSSRTESRSMSTSPTTRTLTSGTTNWCSASGANGSSAHRPSPTRRARSS